MARDPQWTTRRLVFCFAPHLSCVLSSTALRVSVADTRFHASPLPPHSAQSPLIPPLLHSTDDQLPSFAVNTRHDFAARRETVRRMSSGIGQGELETGSRGGAGLSRMETRGTGISGGTALMRMITRGSVAGGGRAGGAGAGGGGGGYRMPSLEE